MMTSAILIDQKANALQLKRYLAENSSDLANLIILEKADLMAMPGHFATVRFLFGTWHMPVLSETEITEHFPSLEIIFYAAGDTSYFAKPYQSRGVKVFSAQAENSIPVAEFVLGQILLANKGYFQAEAIYRRGFWRFGYKKARALSQAKQGNSGAKVGIIGLGSIGTRLVDLLQRFDLQVFVHDPYVSDESVMRLGVVRMELEELFASCDVISSHLPDTADTRGLLDYSYFSLMKANATFINSGRGRQINEPGLIKAMREVPSRAALLDVTRREPPLPFSPLYRVKNIFLSPHIAGSQSSEIYRLYGAAFSQYHQNNQGSRSCKVTPATTR